MKAWIAVVLVTATVMLGVRPSQAQPIPTVASICVSNQSGLSSAQITPVIGAVQKQLDGDFAKAWGETAELTQVCYPHENQWTVNLISDPPTWCGCTGAHGYSREQGPIAFVAVKTDQPWSITLSHEVLEMIVNPRANRITLNRLSGMYYDVEIGDPVETYSYKIDGIGVSDFVFPAWFNNAARGPYDQMAKASRAFDSYDEGRPNKYEPVSFPDSHLAR